MFGALILLSLAHAQDGPEIVQEPSIDVRPRAVFNHTDGLSRGFLSNASVLERARMGIGLERATVSGLVGVQEFRGWEYDNEAADYLRIEPTFEAYEAWGRFTGSLPGNVSAELTAGRQLLTLHRGRLISENDQSFRGLPLDALTLRLGFGQGQIFMSNFRDFSDTSSLSDPGASIISVGYEHDGPVNRYSGHMVSMVDFFSVGLRNTNGLVGSVAVGRWQLDAEVYSQTLDIEPDPDAFSMMTSVETGITLGPERLLSVLGGYAVQTANMVSKGRMGAFDSPAGDVYEYWGHMNLFQRPADTDLRGLQDVWFTLASQPHARVNFQADLHRMWTQYNAVHLGDELDLVLHLQVSPIGAVEGGLMQFWGGDGLAEISDVQVPFRTGYLQIRVALPDE